MAWTAGATACEEGDGTEIALEGECGGGDGARPILGRERCDGCGPAVVGIAREVDGVELDELAVVQQPDRAIEGLALELDAGQGVAAGDLVGDTAQGDDVVGGDAARAGDEEAAAQLVIAAGEP